MADYSYASIMIGGRIPSADAAKAIVDAILFENLCGNEEEARLVLEDAIRAGKPLTLDDDDQVAGGTFQAINDAVRGINGVSCATSYDQSIGYCAGYLGIDENGIEHTATGDGDMPTLPLGAVMASEGLSHAHIAANIATLVRGARLASGYDMPALTASPDALAWIKA